MLIQLVAPLPSPIMSGPGPPHAGSAHQSSSQGPKDAVSSCLSKTHSRAWPVPAGHCLSPKEPCSGVLCKPQVWIYSWWLGYHSPLWTRLKCKISPLQKSTLAETPSFQLVLPCNPAEGSKVQSVGASPWLYFLNCVWVVLSNDLVSCTQGLLSLLVCWAS